MENQMQIFNHNDFGELGVLLIDGKPYFPATEYAKALGYNQPEHAVKRHCKGCTFHTLLTAGGTQQKKFIPEGDLYRLIIRSKLPEAVRFETFVFDEVLPSIRQHNGYVTDNALDQFIENPEEAMKFFNSLKEERTKKDKLNEYVKALEPKAQYCDIILQCPDLIPVTIIAKEYGYSAVAFNRLLFAFHFQFKQSGTWVLYQPYADKGYTQTQTYHIDEKRSVIHTYFTQKGRNFVYHLLKSKGILLLAERKAIKDTEKNDKKNNDIE